jgi:anti-sigma regulatory factor (Ser/Thr protein kinase)
MTSGQIAGGAFSHRAVYYNGSRDYLTAVLPFVRDGLADGEPVLVAIPGPAAGLLRERLNGQIDGLTFGDITELGRNPGRIISAIWDFIDQHRGRPVRVVGEPIWPSRSAAETREVVRHEALVNLAFAASAASFLCPYDVSQLRPRITASASRTHPVIQTLDGPQVSTDYVAGRVPRASARPLSKIPAGAEQLAYRAELRPVRALVTRHARRAGLDEDRVADLVLAVGEVAANTLRHTLADGVVHVWRGRGEIICQVIDEGRIRDPLAGRRRPLEVSGLGLWVVHQVCDLVELRTGRRGTTVRMHMRLNGRGGEAVSDRGWRWASQELFARPG